FLLWCELIGERLRREGLLVAMTYQAAGVGEIRPVAGRSQSRLGAVVVGIVCDRAGIDGSVAVPVDAQGDIGNGHEAVRRRAVVAVEGSERHHEVAGRDAAGDAARGRASLVVGSEREVED